MTDGEEREKNRAALEGMLAYARDYGVQVDFTGQFKVKSPRPVEGKWYVAATCGYCTKVTPYLSDPSEGKVDIPPAEGFLQVDCYYCGEQTRAQTAQLQRLRWPS